MVTSGETTEGLTHCPGMGSSGPCSRCGLGLVSGTVGSCWWGQRWVLTEAEGSERFCPETQAVWLPGAAMTVVWDSLRVSELRPGVRPQAASSMCLVSEFPPVPRWGHTAPPPIQPPRPTALALRDSLRGVGHQPCLPLSCQDLVATCVSSISSSAGISSTQCPAACLVGYRAGRMS